MLPYLNPTTQGYTLKMNPDDYQSDGTHALKVIFKEIGEIDYICAPGLTDEPTKRVSVRGVEVDLETPAEIIAKKVHYRGGTLQPRDMFDIASVARAYGDDYVIEALLPLKEKAALALNVAENMNEGFARNIMSKLQFRDGYGDIAENAQATTVSLLRSVCGHEPSASASPSSPSPR